MNLQHISLRPLAGSNGSNGPNGPNGSHGRDGEQALGIEIVAPDLPELNLLDRAKRAAIIREIHAVWLVHKLIVFRDLSLTPTQQAEFCAHLGELDVYPFVSPTDEHPNVIPIIKEPGDKMNFGGVWHTDTSYMETPPKATCLYAREVPATGGDTLFADTAAAWKALPADTRERVRDLTGLFTPALVHGQRAAFGSVNSGLAAAEESAIVEKRVEHPVIRTHPETGARSIYATPIHCECFVGMTREQSLPLLKHLYEFATREEFTQRLTWQQGTLALWDNRCVFHNALNDYQGQRREVHRVTLKGDTPR